MQIDSVRAIADALNRAQVRYLIVGGLAVVAHGYVRFTADVDLVLAVDDQNLARAIGALKDLDYRPRAPVPIESFADPRLRAEWASQKGMVVFSLFSPTHTATEVDLFLEPPLDFNAAYSRAAKLEVTPGVTGPFAALRDLIDLKTNVGRPRDLDDVEHLRRILEEGSK